MSPSDERIEVLISRKLDGELTDPEAAELAAGLSRSPELVELMASSERIDRACAEAIAEAVNPLAGTGMGEVGDSPNRIPRRRLGGLWWVAPSALAACLALVLVWPLVQPDAPTYEPMPPLVQMPQPAELVAAGQIVALPELRRQGWIRQAGTGKGLTDRRRDREVYGLLGDDGNIYFIEIDRSRSYRRPRDGSKIRLTSGGL